MNLHLKEMMSLLLWALEDSATLHPYGNKDYFCTEFKIQLATVLTEYTFGQGQITSRMSDLSLTAAYLDKETDFAFSDIVQVIEKQFDAIDARDTEKDTTMYSTDILKTTMHQIKEKIGIASTEWPERAKKFIKDHSTVSKSANTIPENPSTFNSKVAERMKKAKLTKSKPLLSNSIEDELAKFENLGEVDYGNCK